MSGACGSFLRARLAALYLLSTSAVYAGLVAWKPGWIDGPLLVGWPPALLALAALAGQGLHDRLSLLADRAGRGRFRSAGATAHAAVAILGFLGLFLRQSQAAEAAVRAMVCLQPLFLLFAGLGRGHQGTLLNALLLTIFASLAGGPLAAAAVVACAVFVALFLSADHYARLLLEYPVRDAPGSWLVAREALPPAAALGAALSLFFVLVPPLPFAPFLKAMPAATVSPDLLLRLLFQLLGIAIFAGIAFYLLMRWGGGGAAEAREPEGQKAAARRRPEPAPVTGDAPPEPPLDGWRAKVVRVYVRALEQLARWGVRRKPSQTPAEFALKLDPPGEASILTALFVRARYGFEDLSEADLKEAERAAEAVLRRKP
ncbi:MAG TPA: DUF4129 domain-containing protein [Planctomycetota bacterium]